MEQKTIRDRLQEAASDPFNNAMFLVFALRQRGRSRLTVVGMMKKMRREGFLYPQEKYRSLIKLLGSLGLGRVKLNARGIPVSLENLTYSLQSVGEAALGKKTEMEKAKNMPKFRNDKPPKLEAAIYDQAITGGTAPKVIERAARTPRPWQTASSKIILTVLINDKPINIPVPRNLSPNEIAAIVARFQDQAVADDVVEPAGSLPDFTTGTQKGKNQ